MSRPSSGGFVLGFAAEIAIVVAAVSILPRINLSGRQEADNSTLAASALRETAYLERPALRNEQPAAPASLPPRLTFIPQTPPAPSQQRQPPPLIAVDPARPAYVEQRLDRASQGLVNSLGTYASRAEKLLREPVPANPPPQTQTPVAPVFQRPAYTPPPPATATGSFATQHAAPSPPRPWVRY